MKYSTGIIAFLITGALASPAPILGLDIKIGGGKKEYCSPGWPKGVSKHVFEFKQTYDILAKPDQVIATDGTPTPGQPGAVGYFKFGINPWDDTICYNITLLGVTGDYQSPARTATHIHEAAKGKAGPPRISFPNPVGDDKRRVSAGCLKGPFVTGLTNAATGLDQGAGFKVQQIIDNPAGFFTDIHTVAYPAGAVRGQLG